MLRGETVAVELSDGTTYDLDNVLVAQTDLTDLTVLDVQMRFINQARYKGDTETLTLQWPKSDHSVLNNAHVTIRGNRYRVYSNPMPYDDSICPTNWDRSVTVLRSLFLFDIELVRETPYMDEYAVWHMRREYVPVKANMLRYAGSSERAGRTEGYEHLTMWEIPLDVYNGETLLRYDGQLYRARDTAKSTDTVVMTCGNGVVEDDEDGDDNG
jgi:hypothetical protein